MRCADCRSWVRNETPSWAERLPERWARMEQDVLTAGSCRRQRADRATAMMWTDYSEIETRETFACVQFEARQ